MHTKTTSAAMAQLSTTDCYHILDCAHRATWPSVSCPYCGRVFVLPLGLGGIGLTTQSKLGTVCCAVPKFGGTDTLSHTDKFTQRSC